MNQRELRGRPASPGFAQGPLFVLGAAAPIATVRAVQAPAQARAALADAITTALDALRALAGAAAAADPDAAAILGFQIAVLEDDVLAAPAMAEIDLGRQAHDAWRDCMDAEIASYLEGADEYFRARAADLLDMRDRVLAALAGEGLASGVPPGAVLVAPDLPPSRFLGIDWKRGGAIALTAGSTTSHVAMLARAHGVPMLVAVDGDLAELAELARQGAEAALVDAESGRLIVAPSAQASAAFAQAAADYARTSAAARDLERRPAQTADGVSIAVQLNLADPAELEHLDPAVCDGIGLVRTEFLFERSGGLPNEDSQFAVYRRLIEWADGRPVTIRTLDAGGDKPIPGLTIDGESNPFLGVRGLRLSLARPDVFRVQLRALARAAVVGKTPGQVKVMLPMVTVPAELEAARVLLEQELAALAAAGVACARPRLGIMIEVPAAALAIDDFAADFFSIGSNDLTQYTAAAGRDNGAVSDLADPTQPAVLRLIREVVDGGLRRNLEVSLCGDAGADPRAIPALLATGLRTLSVAPAGVARAKQTIAQVAVKAAVQANAQGNLQAAAGVPRG
jgi:phosphotransferase system enzyme I (PtsI)